MGTDFRTDAVRTMRASTGWVLGLNDTLNLAIRLCTMISYLGGPPLKFQSLRDNNLRGMDKIASTS